MAQLKATTINGDVTLETGGKIVNSTDETLELIDTNIKLSGEVEATGSVTSSGKLTVSENRVLIRETTASDYSVLEFGNDSFALLGGFFAGGSTASGYGGAHAMNIINIQNAPLALGTGNGVRMTIGADGNITATGSITASGYKSGATTGQTTTATIVTDVRDNAGQMQKKTQLLTFTAGLLTAKGAETDWTDTTDI
jgi:hypothetical protein